MRATSTPRDCDGVAEFAVSSTRVQQSGLSDANSAVPQQHHYCACVPLPRLPHLLPSALLHYNGEMRCPALRLAFIKEPPVQTSDLGWFVCTLAVRHPVVFDCVLLHLYCLWWWDMKSLGWASQATIYEIGKLCPPGEFAANLVVYVAGRVGTPVFFEAVAQQLGGAAGFLNGTCERCK